MSFNELIINALEKNVPEIVEDFKLNDKIICALDDHITLSDIVEAAVEDSDLDEIVGILGEIAAGRGIELTIEKA